LEKRDRLAKKKKTSRIEVRESGDWRRQETTFYTWGNMQRKTLGGAKKIAKKGQSGPEGATRRKSYRQIALQSGVN